jgi:hypothetical protein
MISDDDKTPSVVTLVGIEVGGTPPPVVTPRPVLASLKKPPLGRPAGAFSVSEMVEQIKQEVRRAASADLERRQAELRAEVQREQDELRAELTTEIRTATGLGIAALLMNALAIVASLAFSRVLPVRGLALTLAGLTAVFVGAVRLGGRRRSQRRDLTTR